MKKIISIALLAFCALTVSAQKRITTEEYINKYKHLVIEKQEVYGIPASISMAQGLLESDCGNSRLAIEANNHFGIKCKNDWTGMTISHDDDAKGECFRKYRTVEESYKDHSEFLDKSARYAELFNLSPTDYKGWAHGLKKCGYATNPRYAELLIKIIEDNKLYLLDTQADLIVDTKIDDTLEPIEIVGETAGDAEKIDVDNFAVSLRSVAGYQVYVNNGSEFVVAKRGDSYASISRAVGISERKLRKFNDASPTDEPVAGSAVYIRAKSNKATNGKLLHTARPGETLHSLSQQYGIKLKRLAKLNRLNVYDKLSAGQQVRLM